MSCTPAPRSTDHWYNACRVSRNEPLVQYNLVSPGNLRSTNQRPLYVQPRVAQGGHLAEEVFDYVGIVVDKRGIQHKPPLRR